MKFFALTVVVAAAASVAAAGNQGKGNTAAAANAKNAGSAASKQATAAANAKQAAANAKQSATSKNAATGKNTGAAASSNNSNSNSNTGAATDNNSNIQESLTLTPDVICTACTDDGQNPPVDLQSASLTSSNNFINYCLGKTLTNGQQLVDGSCNGVVLGQIIPSSNMPSSKIIFPPNGGTFPANEAFTFSMNIENLETGNFVNAQTNYFGAPQQVKNNIVVGHTHVTVQSIPAIDSTDVVDPETFAFFKGINQAATNGVLDVNVTAGLPAGVYRFCTMNTDANHTPALVAIAQHGCLDDCIYATAVDNGGSNNNGTAAAADTSSSAAASASTSSSAAASASTTAAASGKNNTGKNTGAGAASGKTGSKTNAGGKTGTKTGSKTKGRGRAGRGRRPH